MKSLRFTASIGVGQLTPASIRSIRGNPSYPFNTAKWGRLTDSSWQEYVEY